MDTYKMKRSNQIMRAIWVPALIGLIMFVSVPTPVKGAVTQIVSSGQIQLVLGKSVILESAKPVKRVSIADPEIADFVLLSSPWSRPGCTGDGS